MAEIQNFKPAKLHTKKVWYISLKCFDPETSKLKEKRYKLMNIEDVRERRRYAKQLIETLNTKLYAGWNPFIDAEAKKEYKFFKEVVNHFLQIAEKKHADGLLAVDSIKDYRSVMKIFSDWLKKRGDENIYVYQIEKIHVIKFLDYIYIEQKRTPQTRNNYLNMLAILSGFMVEYDYKKYKITDGIKKLRITGKIRKIISEDKHLELKSYLEINDKHFLLACEILFYTFIRPREMSEIKIKHINFKTGTIFIPAANAKNKKDGVVTIPQNLGNLLIELKIHEFPSEYFLFSDGMTPGTKQKDGKIFRDKWLIVRRKLNFPDSYQFYSLKDTGITKMLNKTGNSLLVRDQARHHSLSVTDKYTDKSNTLANKTISDLTY